MTALLLVEDEESLASSLSFSLEKFGYQVQVASDGNQAMETLVKSRPDLILLDVMLPGKDGFEICKAMQKFESPIPIIMITARSSETDRIVGLELGADDYVIKPFSTRELEARIKVVLRRRKSDSTPSERDLEIDLERQIIRREGEPIQLSPREWEVLRCLMSRNGRIVSREELLQEVWGENFEGDPKTVEIHIHWLRQKLEKDSANPKHVITVKRKGYRFEL